MNILAASLSITSFFVLWGVFCKVLSERRSAFLSASILWAIWAVLITEILSLFRALTFAAVLAAWGIIFSLALIGWIRLMGFPKNPWWRFKLPKIPRFEFFVLSAGTFIVFVVGLIAFVAPPNTWDSMTYHLPRVMHWIQDRSVAYYPTFILRQLYLAPGAEYLILQFQIL